MRNAAAILLLVLVASLAWVPSGAAQGRRDRARLSVVVTDTLGVPLAGARVRVFGGAGAASTGANGVVALSNLQPGTRLVEVARSGYRSERFPVDFAAGVGAEVEVALAPETTVLPTVAVEVEPSSLLEQNGFYARQRLLQGTYLTREQIAAMNRMRALDLFRGIQGLRVIRRPGGRGSQVVSARGAPSINRSVCPIGIFLDGAAVSQDVLEQLAADVFEGVEVYAGPAQLPPQFNSAGSGCGVVLLWSRER